MDAARVPARRWSIRHLMLLIALVAIDVALLRTIVSRQIKMFDWAGILLMASIQVASPQAYSCRRGIRPGWLAWSAASAIVLALFVSAGRDVRSRIVLIGRFDEREILGVIHRWTPGAGLRHFKIYQIDWAIRCIVPLLLWTSLVALALLGLSRLAARLLPRPGSHPGDGAV